MLMRTAIQAAGNRAGRPATWAVVLGIGLLWNGVRAGFLSAPLHWEEAMLPFLLGFLGMVLAPFPWQWTGDGDAMARPGRGVLQGILWCALWVALVFLALPLHGPEQAGRGRGRGGGPPWAESAGGLSPRMLGLASASLAFALALGLAVAQTERAERLEAEVREHLRAAQVRALQAQMNPHVLFNLIGALAEMAREDPMGTEQALLRLASLLRRLLAHGERPRAALSEERALVEDYLALERLRLGARLRVAWAWDHALEAREAQPLLLQPLVENAVKHGIARAREGGDLVITLAPHGAGVLLRVANTGAALKPGPEGIGLGNLRNRLTLMGDPGAALDLRSEGAWTVAELVLPGVACG